MSKTHYHEAGKGSKKTPRYISQEEYDRRWEETFGKKKDKDQERSTK